MSSTEPSSLLSSTRRRRRQNTDSLLIKLLLSWGVILVVFILGPLFIDFSPPLAPTDFRPYAPDDLLEQVEPLLSIPVNYFILAHADVIVGPVTAALPTSTRMRSLLVLLFLVGATAYVEGHGGHFASKIAKRSIDQAQKPYNCFQKKAFNVTSDPACIGSFKAYQYVRDDMEHIITHWIYAAGAILMSLSHTLSFRNHTHLRTLVSNENPQAQSQTSMLDCVPPPIPPMSIGLKVAFYAAAILYGLLVAGITINFPYGFHVILPLLVAHCIGIVWMALPPRHGTTGELPDLELDITEMNGSIRIPKEVRKGERSWRGVGEFLKCTFWAPNFDGRALVLQYYLVSYAFALLPIIGWIICFRSFVSRENAGVPL